jgi:hypothetical protein
VLHLRYYLQRAFRGTNTCSFPHIHECESYSECNTKSTETSGSATSRHVCADDPDEKALTAVGSAVEGFCSRAFNLGVSVRPEKETPHYRIDMHVTEGMVRGWGLSGLRPFSTSNGKSRLVPSPSSCVSEVLSNCSRIELWRLVSRTPSRHQSRSGVGAKASFSTERSQQLQVDDFRTDKRPVRFSSCSTCRNWDCSP